MTETVTRSERYRELADGASQTRNGGVNITPEPRA